MAYDQRSLDDYVDVAERISEFRDKYPDGTLQPADLAEPSPRDWFCPRCGMRLSYGIYCKACEEETTFAWRPVSSEIGQLMRLLATLPAPSYPGVFDELS